MKQISIQNYNLGVYSTIYTHVLAITVNQSLCSTSVYNASVHVHTRYAWLKQSLHC